jgi:hypothetical protein
MLLRDQRWQRPLGHLIENFTVMNVTSTWTKGLLSCLLEIFSCIQDSAVKLRFELEMKRIQSLKRDHIALIHKLTAFG